MGMWTRIQAATSNKIGGVYTIGFANPTLYAIGKNTTSDPLDFFDIGGGPPTSPATGNGAYVSQPRSSPADPSGWDYVSGLGAPNVTHLGQDATGNNTFTPTNNIAAPPPKDCGQPGLLPCQGGGPTCSTLTGLWTNPAHTATDTLTNSDPQLSLLHGDMSVSADGLTLRTFLTVTNMSLTVPTGAGAAEWYSLWTFGGTVYFSNMELTNAPGATPTFSDGTVTVTGTSHLYNTAHTDTGQNPTLGPNGVVEVNVPLANVGNPPLSSTFSGPSGETRILIGAAGSGSLPLVDSGGPACDFSLTNGPVSPPGVITPEVPYALLIPMAGLATAGSVLMRRRQRQRRRVG
jgi:hypothetical protein